MSQRYCEHGYASDRCPFISTACPNVDRRELVQQLFGRPNPNSALAARIAAENMPTYKKLQAAARELGLLPQVNTPRCLQDE